MIIQVSKAITRYKNDTTLPTYSFSSLSLKHKKERNPVPVNLTKSRWNSIPGNSLSSPTKL
jgi:hypothetical protein